jgi:hypothetical protein
MAFVLFTSIYAGAIKLVEYAEQDNYLLVAIDVVRREAAKSTCKTHP